jgi:acetyltransferase-like isoleucine patch superfamily enzyme
MFRPKKSVLHLGRAGQMPTNRIERKTGHAIQEFLSALPSLPLVRRLHAFYCRGVLGSCGDNLDISRDVIFEFPKEIALGNRVFINRGTLITARAPIQIGDDVLIGPYVIINSGNHGYKDETKLIRLQDHVTAPISIGNDVWIGAHAVILAGVTIGDGAVIAAGRNGRAEGTNKAF